MPPLASIGFGFKSDSGSGSNLDLDLDLDSDSEMQLRIVVRLQKPIELSRSQVWRSAVGCKVGVRDQKLACETKPK